MPCINGVRKQEGLMRPMTRPEFAKEITILAEVFETELTEARLEIYWHALKDLSLDELKQAIEKLVKTITFHKLPLPAEIIEVANEGKRSNVWQDTPPGEPATAEEKQQIKEMIANLYEKFRR